MSDAFANNYLNGKISGIRDLYQLIQSLNQESVDFLDIKRLKEELIREHKTLIETRILGEKKAS